MIIILIFIINSQPPHSLQNQITHILKSLPADLTTDKKAKFQILAFQYLDSFSFLLNPFYLHATFNISSKVTHLFPLYEPPLSFFGFLSFFPPLSSTAYYWSMSQHSEQNTKYLINRSLINRWTKKKELQNSLLRICEYHYNIVQ